MGTVTQTWVTGFGACRVGNGKADSLETDSFGRIPSYKAIGGGLSKMECHRLHITLSVEVSTLACVQEGGHPASRCGGRGPGPAPPYSRPGSHPY